MLQSLYLPIHGVIQFNRSHQIPNTKGILYIFGNVVYSPDWASVQLNRDYIHSVVLCDDMCAAAGRFVENKEYSQRNKFAFCYTELSELNSNDQHTAQRIADALNDHLHTETPSGLNLRYASRRELKITFYENTDMPKMLGNFVLPSEYIGFQ